MTTEGEIREILNEYRVRCVHGGKIGIDADQAAQAIFELVKPQEDIDTLTKSAYLKGVADGKEKMKPMSQKRLARIINSWWKNLSEKRKLSEVILAEWEKGLK